MVSKYEQSPGKNTDDLFFIFFVLNIDNSKILVTSKVKLNSELSI